MQKIYKIYWTLGVTHASQLKARQMHERIDGLNLLSVRIKARCEMRGCWEKHINTPVNNLGFLNNKPSFKNNVN